MQQGVTAYTVPQPEEAMPVLKEKASQLGVSIQPMKILYNLCYINKNVNISNDHIINIVDFILLQIPLHVVSPLDSGALKDQHLGLGGEHQYINAGLAISLSRAWLKETGNTEGINFEDTVSLIGWCISFLFLFSLMCMITSCSALKTDLST